MTNETLLFIKIYIYIYIYIYISHFILDVSVVRDEWRPGQTAILTQLLLHLGWGCSTGGRWELWPSVYKLALTLAFLCPTNSTAAGTYLYSFIMPTCFGFTQVHLWLTAQSRVNIQQSSTPLIFQMSTYGHFSRVPLHPPHTYILQIMLKNNNSKNTKRNYLNNSKNNTILRQLEGNLSLCNTCPV